MRLARAAGGARSELLACGLGLGVSDVFLPMSARDAWIEILAREMFALMIQRGVANGLLPAPLDWGGESEFLRDDWRAVARLAWERVTDVVCQRDVR